MVLLLMCIIVYVNSAPAEYETTLLLEDSTTIMPPAITTTSIFLDTGINEVDGKSPNDELLELTTTSITAASAQTTEMTTIRKMESSEIDKGFDFKVEKNEEEESLQDSTTKDSIIEISTQPSSSQTDDSNSQFIQHYREMLRRQFLRTLLIMLSEIKKRQMQQQQPPLATPESTHEMLQEESKIVENSMPSISSAIFNSDCECEIDDVSTSDDGKVIVFDENTGKYVYVDGKDLEEKIQERNAQHVSVI